MNIQAAILCDFAQVRGGTLFVASGGVSRLQRPAGLPSSLGIHLALILELDPDEVETVHEVRVTVIRDGGSEEIGRVTAALQGPPGAAAGLNPGEPAVVPIAIPLNPITIAEQGMYDIRVSVDGGVPEIRTVYVVPLP